MTERFCTFKNKTTIQLKSKVTRSNVLSGWTRLQIRYSITKINVIRLGNRGSHSSHKSLKKYYQQINLSDIYVSQPQHIYSIAKANTNNNCIEIKTCFVKRLHWLSGQTRDTAFYRSFYRQLLLTEVDTITIPAEMFVKRLFFARRLIWCYWQKSRKIVSFIFPLNF